MLGTLLFSYLLIGIGWSLPILGDEIKLSKLYAGKKISWFKVALQTLLWPYYMYFLYR